ncbi:response regulator [Vibrio algivorus]|uniref:histidine kinase n=1 Tax=Vibrio algivorus TaxID=1667024 RepID=A0A557PDV8_9VIBR|nr:response regulator [Vibrio algivorus]TVO38830.1 response regulator [Vibrio algivorus]
MFKPNKTHKFQRLQHTLMVAFLVLSLTPLTIIGLFFLHSHTQDLQEQSTSYLTSVRDTKKQQINDYLKSKESEVMGMVRSELAYASGGRFYGLISAFNKLGDTPDQARINAQQRYILGSGDQIKTSVLPESPNYASTERYRLLHKRYHWAYVDVLKRSDFSDILLVDLEGDVAYSVNKNDEFGTNLISGKYKDSPLGHTFQQLIATVKESRKNNEDYTPIILSDFSSQNGEQILWIGAPIIQQGYLHSYAMFKLPSTALTNTVADNNKDVTKLLVGTDQQAKIQGITSDQINASNEVVTKALAGKTAVESFTNSLHEKVIAAYTPINTQGKTWALVIELPEKDAYSRVQQLKHIFYIVMLIGILVVFICSHYLSNFITRPLLKLTWVAERVSAGDLSQDIINIDRKDEIGRLATSFARMQRSIKDKIELIGDQNAKLEDNIKIIRQQNDELHLANKLKDEFLATTSHELRTPLHGMVGIAEALNSGANGPIPANQKHQLSIIINSGQRLATLVDDLLDYHKMRYGNLDIQTTTVDLAATTKLVLELSKHLLGSKPIRIINQTPQELPLVLADAQRLEQVLYNLVGNAIKYTSEGKIIISATVLEQKVRIQVVDTGQGIPADQLEHIFEPLIQAGQDASRYRQGAGLGLSISRQLIELMGGTLYVSSQPMVGTTFSFSLPIASQQQIDHYQQGELQNHFQAPDTHNFVNIDDSSLPQNPNGPLLIVADDEPVNLQILDSFLRLEGYRVRTASDGVSAIQLIEEEKPELVLLDIMMPGMSGYEACQEIRKQYDHGQLPIILLTALSQTNDRIKGFDCGANDYLTKPFNKQELAARIRAHLTASKAEIRRLENAQLQQELRIREQVEASLLETQGRLLEQLESAPEAIICVRDDGRVRFANDSAAKLFKRTPEQLKRSQADEIIAPKFLKTTQEHFCGEIDIFIEDKREHIKTDILTLPEGSGLKYIYIFNVGSGINAQRIDNLETAIEALSSYAFEGDKNKLQQLKELGGEFTRLADKVSNKSEDKQQIMREILVETMNCALDYWESDSGQTKFNLAEQSGLWRVYLDRSTLQTRTLDKYLRIETLPKTPRWRTVLNTIDYILQHTSSETPQRQHLLNCREKLQTLITT